MLTGASRKVKAGDDTVYSTRPFTPWYEVEYSRLVAVLERLGVEHHTARDIAAEAFSRALERWERVGRMQSPTGWTYQVAFNLLHRHARRAHLERQVLSRAQPGVPSAPLEEGLHGPSIAPPSIEDLQRRTAARRRRRVVRSLSAALVVVIVAAITVAKLLGTESGHGRQVQVLSPPQTVPAKPFFPPVSSQATTSSSVADTPLFTPRSIAFWTPTQGILVGTNTTQACGRSGTCTDGVVEKTTDGGVSWNVVGHLKGDLVQVAVAGPGAAWMLGSLCGATSATGCPSTLIYRTNDGGLTWHATIPSVTLRSIAPTSFLNAWAVQGDQAGCHSPRNHPGPNRRRWPDLARDA